MVGDNIYEGPATADDYRLKFEDPYTVMVANPITGHSLRWTFSEGPMAGATHSRSCSTTRR
jgi:hypothetical protein